MPTGIIYLINTKSMKEYLIRGNKALAAQIGVSQRTISQWRSEGILSDATVADFRRTIIYDIRKVFECLQNKKVKPGRKQIL